MIFLSSLSCWNTSSWRVKKQLLVPASLRALPWQYPLLWGESSDISAYLILNGSQCLASLSGISLRTNDLHTGALLLCKPPPQPNFHIKIFSSCPRYYQPVAVLFTLSKPGEESRLFGEGLNPQQCRAGLVWRWLSAMCTHTHTHCGSSLPGPVFLPPLNLSLVVVCLAITWLLWKFPLPSISSKLFEREWLRLKPASL